VFEAWAAGAETSTRGMLLDALNHCRSADGSERSRFKATLDSELRQRGLTLPTDLMRAIWDAVSVPDPEGEVQRDKRGKPIPSPDLRASEYVRVNQELDEYLAAEVFP